MKFQRPTQQLCLFVLLASVMPFLVRAQNTANMYKEQLAIKPRDQKFIVKDKEFDYDYPENQRWHGGMSFSGTFMNAKGTVNPAFVFVFGFDVLKYKWYALSFEVKPEVPLISNTDFGELPLVAEHNFNFGNSKYNGPAWGFYFGGGISYVVNSYLKATGDANSANFWGYIINGGVRISHFDIGFSKATSLRGIDQIANPALYEIILGVRF